MLTKTDRNIKEDPLNNGCIGLQKPKQAGAKRCQNPAKV
jgi:hypothetical protein